MDPVTRALQEQPVRTVARHVMRAILRGWYPWRSQETGYLAIMVLPGLPDSKRHKHPRLRVKGFIRAKWGLGVPRLTRRRRRQVGLDVVVPKELDAEAFAALLYSAVDATWPHGLVWGARYHPGTDRVVAILRSRIFKWALRNE